MERVRRRLATPGGRWRGGTPVFGACYGHQLLAYALGGKVYYHPRRHGELGTQAIELLPAADDVLLTVLPRRFNANLVH